MYNEGIVLSCRIEAMEGRDVATSDIPVYLLQTGYNKGDILIKMEEVMVNLLEGIDPAYYKYLIYL